MHNVVYWLEGGKRICREFDYSNETSNDLYDAVDGLSYEEAVFAKEAIEKIKEEKEEKKVMKFKKWFNEALFPILNEFAAVSGCCLKIDRMRVAV